VTRGDVMRSFSTPGGGDATLLQAGESNPVTAFPDETLYDALAQMLRRDVGRLVVVDRKDPLRVVGYLGRREILAARQRHHLEEEQRQCGPLRSLIRGGSKLPPA
jgi:CBS domain-containing protein